MTKLVKASVALPQASPCSWVGAGSLALWKRLRDCDVGNLSTGELSLTSNSGWRLGRGHRALGSRRR